MNVDIPDSHLIPLAANIVIPRLMDVYELNELDATNAASWLMGRYSTNESCVGNYSEYLKSTSDCVICYCPLTTENFFYCASCKSRSMCKVCIDRHIEANNGRTSKPMCPLCKAEGITALAYDPDTLHEHGIDMDLSWTCADCSTLNEMVFCTKCGDQSC